MRFSLGPGPFGVLLVIVLLATVGGRLLGIRLRWWRALVAAFPGLVIGIVFIYALEGHPRRAVALPTLPVLLAALVATMLIAVLLELLARPGRLAGVQGRLSAQGIPHPLRSLRARAGRVRRYLQVTHIAGRHGLAAYIGAQRPGSRPDARTGGREAAGNDSAAATRREGSQAQARSLGRSLRLTLEECGGIFVKLGQVLSTRPDLLPAGVVAELTGLQDNVAAVPWAEIEPILAAELGAPARDVFAWFDHAPLAAASIAQAHRARLKSGEEVVVKVQRPGVHALVERDLGILLKLARSLEARASWAREYRVGDMASGFAEALREELDFRIEARNLAAVAGTTTVRVPAVYSAMSTSRVLVMEWLDGVSARNAGVLLERTGADRATLARALLACILRQVMLEGTFHADPHPGNVLILKDKQLALIDFGSVGRLDPLQQAGLRRLLTAVARRNPGELHDALTDLADIHTRTGHGDELLERALAQFMAQHLGPGMVPDASMFTTLFMLLAEFGISFPPVIGGVFRTIITLEGTLAALAPGFQMVDETRALASSWLGELFAPSSLRETATDELLALLPALRRLPRRFDRISSSLERGTLGVNVRLFADTRDTSFITSIVNRALMAFCGAALGIISVALLAIHGGPFLLAAPHSSGIAVFRLLGYLGLFFSSVLILRVVIAITREGITPGAGTRPPEPP